VLIVYDENFLYFMLKRSYIGKLICSPNLSGFLAFGNNIKFHLASESVFLIFLNKQTTLLKIYETNEESEIDRGSVDQISHDQNCHLSLDQKFHFHLIKFFETFHLIKTFNNVFDQTPKKLSLDQKFY